MAEEHGSSLSPTARAVFKAAPQLLAMLPDSLAGQFLRGVEELHGKADGKLRVAELFVAIAEGRTLQLSEEEQQLLEAQFVPDFQDRRHFLRAAGKGALGLAVLGGVNIGVNREVRKLNDAYEEARAGHSSRAAEIEERLEGIEDRRLLVNAAGVSALLGAIARQLPLSPDDTYRPAEMKTRIAQLARGMNAMLKEAVQPGRGK